MIPETRGPGAFGRHVRALRLGYRWSVAMGCYVRVVCLSASIEVSLASADADVSGFDPGRGPHRPGNHTCWWDDDEEGRELLESPRLAELAGKVRGHMLVHLNEDGR